MVVPTWVGGGAVEQLQPLYSNASHTTVLSATYMSVVVGPSGTAPPAADPQSQLVTTLTLDFKSNAGVVTCCD